MLRSGLAATLLVILPQAASAVSTSPQTQTLARAALDQDALKTEAGRAALASAVRGYCAEVSDLYPRNSPQEEAWLSGEVGGSSERLMRAIASPEMGRRQAKFFIDSCTRFVADLDKSPERSKDFVALGYVFIRFSADAVLFARKNNVDADLLGFDVTLRGATEGLLLAALYATQ